MMDSRRVVITGLGLLSPLGNSVADSWSSGKQGKSGVDKISLFDASDYPSQIAGEVKGFDPEHYVPKKEIKRFDRFSLLGLAASDEAWKDAAVADGAYQKERMGVIVGVGIGGLRTMEENYRSLIDGGPRKVSAFLVPAMISNLCPGTIGIRFDLRGVNYTVTSACTSGTHAIGEAFRMIREGRQDLVIAGGAEAGITPLGCAGFSRMKALSTQRNDEPTKASRPFDADRDGFVIGEGAGMLVLEDLKGARKRGAKIYGEVLGYGFSCDAYHITAPPEDGRGAIQAMNDAIGDSGLAPEQIHYINAHGTSTPINDPAETSAIKSVFGEHAKKELLVSSTKSMTGHLLGAAGGLEAVLTVKSLEESTVLPTINLDNPGEGCDLDYVPHQAREVSIEAAMSNSFGFGGTNAAVIMGRVREG